MSRSNTFVTLAPVYKPVKYNSNMFPPVKDTGSNIPTPATVPPAVSSTPACMAAYPLPQLGSQLVLSAVPRNWYWVTWAGGMEISMDPYSSICWSETVWTVDKPRIMARTLEPPTGHAIAFWANYVALVAPMFWYTFQVNPVFGAGMVAIYNGPGWAGPSATAPA